MGTQITEPTKRTGDKARTIPQELRSNSTTKKTNFIEEQFLIATFPILFPFYLQNETSCVVIFTSVLLPVLLHINENHIFKAQSNHY